MMKKELTSKLFVQILMIVLSTLIIISGSVLAAEAQEKYTLRLFSAGEAGATFVSMSGNGGIIRRHNPDIWRSVTTIPSAGPYAGFRAIEAGEGEITYSNPGQMVELWTDTGNFATNPIAEDKKALMGPCLWEHQNILLARADNDEIQSIWDIEGKKVWPTMPGYVTEVVSFMIHEELSIESEMVYVEMDALCDALRDGIVDAAWGYVLSGGAVPSWLGELELRMDAKAVPFTKEDTDLIASKVPGVASRPIKLSDFSSRIQGPDNQYSPVLGTYWVFAPHLPEEAVYEIMVALYENKEAVAEVHPKHSVWAEDPLGLQEEYVEIAAQAGIPIHPGFAKWLKSHGVWHDNWIVGEVTK